MARHSGLQFTYHHQEVAKFEVRGEQGRSSVAILTNIPTPYRLPMFRMLSELTDLKVFFDASTERNRSWSLPDEMGFPNQVARGFSIPYWRIRKENGLKDERYLQLNAGIFRSLRKFRPDLVVSGELGFRTAQAVAYCAFFRVPLIIWSEGTPHTEGTVTAFKRWLRPKLLRHAARCWVNGFESEALLMTYGVAPSQIDRGLIGVDTNFYISENRRLLPGREELRRQLDVSGTVFLFVGQLVDRKGIPELLKALRMLNEQGVSPDSYSIVIAGDGPLLALVLAWKEQHPALRIRVLGFQQISDLPRLYAAADVFVLPTLDDNWSLSALEAAVSGLPQIYSQFNGAGADLQALGAFGATVDPGDIHTLASTIESWIEQTPERLSAEVIEAIGDVFGPAQCTRRAHQSIQSAQAAHRRRINRNHKHQLPTIKGR